MPITDDLDALEGFGFQVMDMGRVTVLVRRRVYDHSQQAIRPCPKLMRNPFADQAVLPWLEDVAGAIIL